jgi:hypothetical protein
MFHLCLESFALVEKERFLNLIVFLFVMARNLALFFNEHTNQYTVNDRGNLTLQPEYCQQFTELDQALQYLTDNYGLRKSELLLDEWCKEFHLSDLEEKLEKTKINIKN